MKLPLFVGFTILAAAAGAQTITPGSTGHGQPSFNCAVNDTYKNIDDGLVWQCGPTANTWHPTPAFVPWNGGAGAGASGAASNALFQQVGPTAPVIAKGSTYDGSPCDALAAPGVHKPASGDSSIVATVSCWGVAASKWFSTFFTTPKSGPTSMKTWTQVAGSSISPGGSDYIAGNGDVIHYSDGNYYFVYTHYPSGQGCLTSETISIRKASTIVGLASASDYNLVTTGYGDPQFALNPSGNLEIWAVQCSGGQSNTYGYWTSSSPSTNTWGSFNVATTYLLDPPGGGEPAPFYIGSDRFITFDACCSTLNGRYTRFYSNPAQAANWYALGASNVPYTLDAWQASQVFDNACDVFDTSDGLGSVPRCLFAGGDNVSTTDNTDSSIGYATGLQSYANLIAQSGCYPLFYLVGSGVGISDPNLCWNPSTQSLTSSAPGAGFQVLDNFAGAASTLLTSHSTIQGQSWSGSTQHSGDCTTFSTVTLSGSGSVSNSAACDASMIVNFTPTSANYTACATGTSSSNQDFDVSGRMSTSADTRYVAIANSGASVINLYKAVAGTYTSLSTYTYAWSGSHKMCLAMNGSASTILSVTLDGLPIISATDSTSPITAAGTAGVVIGFAGHTTVTQFSVQ